MPFIVVWSADVVEDLRTNRRPVGLHTSQIAYAEERVLPSGEKYVSAIMSDGLETLIFEKNLDDIRDLDRAGR